MTYEEASRNLDMSIAEVQGFNTVLAGSAKAMAYNVILTRPELCGPTSFKAIHILFDVDMDARTLTPRNYKGTLRRAAKETWVFTCEGHTIEVIGTRAMHLDIVWNLLTYWGKEDVGLSPYDTDPYLLLAKAMRVAEVSHVDKLPYIYSYLCRSGIHTQDAISEAYELKWAVEGLIRKSSTRGKIVFSDVRDVPPGAVHIFADPVPGVIDRDFEFLILKTDPPRGWLFYRAGENSIPLALPEKAASNVAAMLDEWVKQRTM